MIDPMTKSEPQGPFTQTDDQSLFRLYPQSLGWVQQGRIGEALALLDELVRRQPDNVDFLNNLVALKVYSGDAAQALKHAERAFLLAPFHHTAQIHMGHLLLEQKRYIQATAYFKLAIQSQPQDLEAWKNLAHCLAKQGLIEACLDVLNQACQLAPEDAQLKSVCLYHLLAQPGLEPEALGQAFERWNQSQAVQQPSHFNWPDPERRLKIGYVSGDFRENVATQVFAPLFELRDSQNFELYAYSQFQGEDAETRRFRSLADHWREIYGLSDQAVRAQILQDGIDLLIDLNGLTEQNRLPVFAGKPAPIQLTGPGGFISSTGLSAIDYVIADLWLIPLEQRRWQSETPLYLSSGFHWQPRADYADLPLTAPPSQTRPGRIMLGCGNDTLKLNSAVLRLWAQILQALPQAQLLLKAPGFDEAALRAHFREAFKHFGVEPGRISFEGQTSPHEHLEFYNRIDLALDPFPFNGAISTCDALWMGTPVISLNRGHRVGASILAAVGLQDWIAQDESDYLHKVCALAQTPEQLQSLKQSLRQRLLDSAICDGAGFCRELEVIYRQSWRKWCQQQAVGQSL